MSTRRGWLGALVGLILGACGRPARAGEPKGRLVSAHCIPHPGSSRQASKLRAVWRWNGEDWQRVRMAELRKGDVFKVEGRWELWWAVRDASTVPPGGCGVWQPSDSGEVYVRATSIGVTFERLHEMAGRLAQEKDAPPIECEAESCPPPT